MSGCLSETQANTLLATAPADCDSAETFTVAQRTRVRCATVKVAVTVTVAPTLTQTRTVMLTLTLAPTRLPPAAYPDSNPDTSPNPYLTCGCWLLPSVPPTGEARAEFWREGRGSGGTSRTAMLGGLK